MNTYMDFVHEMAERGPQIAAMRVQSQLMSVSEQDSSYHKLRQRLGAYLMQIGQSLSETPVASAGRQSPSAA